MGLTASQSAIWQKARALGSGEQAVRLTDDACSYLVARIATDLGCEKHFPELGTDVPDFFSEFPSSDLLIKSGECKPLFERLVEVDANADIYFSCLASLHKARLKYDRILTTQPFSTLEQVGPRGLLQYGRLSGSGLTALLMWRKWLYDIDNRAGQETGYLFEPIIASAIGGIAAPARKSPVKRHKDKTKGRHVDCVLDDRAYEFKIRVTTAASGQGRWQEELDFPVDCKNSGFTPVLLCMDGTPNEKLSQLVKVFESNGGTAYVGEHAWKHLDEVAGPTMSVFLDRYVRGPIQDLLNNEAATLPKFSASVGEHRITLTVGLEELVIARDGVEDDIDSEPALPDDADDQSPGIT